MKTLLVPLTVGAILVAGMRVAVHLHDWQVGQSHAATEATSGQRTDLRADRGPGTKVLYGEHAALKYAFNGPASVANDLSAGPPNTAETFDDLTVRNSSVADEQKSSSMRRSYWYGGYPVYFGGWSPVVVIFNNNTELFGTGESSLSTACSETPGASRSNSRTAQRPLNTGQPRNASMSRVDPSFGGTIAATNARTIAARSASIASIGSRLPLPPRQPVSQVRSPLPPSTVTTRR